MQNEQYSFCAWLPALVDGIWIAEPALICFKTILAIFKNLQIHYHVE